MNYKVEFNKALEDRNDLAKQLIIHEFITKGNHTINVANIFNIANNYMKNAYNHLKEICNENNI